MKKTMILALAVTAGASFNMAFADKKKPKAPVQTVKTVALATRTDSLSYASGMSITYGLINYLEKTLHVDTAYMSDVVRGFDDATRSDDTPRQLAYNAGREIARMFRDNALPALKGQFDGCRDTINGEMVAAGFRSALLGDTTLFNMAAATGYSERLYKANREEADHLYAEANAKWLEENKAKPGVKTLVDGIQYKVITAGTGPTPVRTDRVQVRYEGHMIDGTEFDSSYKRSAEPAEFVVERVIPGWTKALLCMPVGSKWELYIPSDQAYGARAAGTIKPHSTLIFTVELVGICKKDAANK